METVGPGGVDAGTGSAGADLPPAIDPPPSDLRSGAAPPRQRAESPAVRIAKRIGSDRPASRVLAGSGAYPIVPAPGPARTERNEASRTGLGRSVPAAEPAPAPERPRRPRREPARRHPALADAAVCAGFVAVAGYLTHGLWPDPHSRGLALGGENQILTEWFLSYGARAYAGDFSLVTDRLNAPEGVNLLSNASVILIAILLGPVTLAFGAPVSFAVALAGNLAGTASGWYLLFARRLGLHRVAAAIGAGFAGFAPGLVAQSNGHPHVTAQWLVPPIVWCALRLADPPDRRQLALTAALLGFLVTLQYHLGAEVLLLAAVGIGLFGAVSWRAVRPRLANLAQGTGIASGLAALLLAYPLWTQFAGPQHVRGGPFPADRFGLDAAALTSIAPLSLAGNRSAAPLAVDAAEFNAYFGVPLLLVLAGIVLWLWRRPGVVPAAATAAGLVALSFGPRLVVSGTRTAIPGPYALVQDLPVFSAALPGRFALAAVPLLAWLLAVAIHNGLSIDGWPRFAVPVAVLAALAPIAPVPLPTEAREPVPRYFAEGYWRGCAAGGGVLVPVPPPEPRQPESMRWATAAGAGFALPEGLFIGPYADGGRASLGTFPRPTSQLLARVAETGQVPEIGYRERDAALEDAAFWRARCFVLAPQRHAEPLRSTMERLYGPPQKVADVWVWRT